MNRRFFMKALAATLGYFSINKLSAAPKENLFNGVLLEPDAAIVNEFRDIICIDENGNSFPVPIIWANDNQTSNKKLPLMNIFRGNLFFGDKIYIYYHLTAQTTYEEHMNQILEQVYIKFNPLLKNKVSTCELISIINNYEPKANSAMRGDIYSLLKHNGNKPVYGKQNNTLKHHFNILAKVNHESSL